MSETIDRILWDHGCESVDEIVVHDCTVHLEQMDDGLYWMGIDKGGDHLAVNLYSDSPIRCIAEAAGPWHWDEDREHEA